MKPIRALARRKAAHGIAAIEFGILLPVLIFLTLPVIDFGRAIQANLVLVNLTREGASLASRASNYTPQFIMDSLGDTATPIQMKPQGMIYITKVMGLCAKGETTCSRNVVLEQHHWLNGWKGAGGSAPLSKVWNCGSNGTSWAGNGSCGSIPTGPSAPTANVMTGSMHDGEIAYVVEAYYGFNMLFKGLTMGVLAMPSIGPNLYSITVF
ncbi:TadE/TadG family type IV pilus assembly protein [Cupriavidus sp. BIC8F]|uniref:TadE family protein n=1 Tax=Cupriavidus sp. BIC8F TaxID=3079014 RepID=UPI002916DB3F|nr:TadE/TadG family type IV pilus assembly protein [Cupriavidus sp. BIC8F]